MRILREPLFHFFLLGLLLFGWFFWLNPADPNDAASDRIVIDVQDIARLTAQFEATWRRPPTEAELQGLLDSLVREEVLVREAQLLGLDQGDGAIRNRLAQKMTFLTTSVAQSIEPDDEVLRAYMDQNQERFAFPPRVSFEQILLKPEEEAGDVLAALNTGADPTQLGAATLLPAEIPLSIAASVDGLLGRGTFEQLAELPEGRWSGPVQSGYGLHVVRLTGREPGALPPFDEIRDRVLQDWRSKQSEELTAAQLKSLKSKYEIVLPEPLATTEGASQ
ncbi:peptidyl-prolyl cis-trans isomerase [Aliiruegeria sabulilitoris]|uniref:peptidylprolyl isomerase n=1 Tax=Aliiruegeria sabulilitoris TaxID=1510458 RepID=UPI000834ED28|nr:peptidylprolyl isomerase [Aliiruegeria sabulilitoris]NDR55410.1 peptidyl-prolyl cis-trans isomerase [Pseudoruegeria sp. M32A2M]